MNRRGLQRLSRLRLGWLVAAAVVTAAGVLIIVLATSGGSVDPDAAVTITQPQVVDSTSAASTVAVAPPTATARVTTTTTLGVRLPAQGPIFGEETGVLLLLDDGIDGLTAVDPDRRLAGRSVVEGQRAGDEQYSMIRVGDKLVVGWGEPYAVDVATRQGMSLGVATVFAPAAEPGRVWMIDSGARIGSQEQEVWQVDVSTGEALQDPVPLAAEGGAQTGIQGGLAFQTDTGLNLWKMDTGQTVPLESSGPGFVHDVYGEELIWCSDECVTLSVTNTSTLETQEYEPPGGYQLFSYETRISPSGRYLAALVGLEGSFEGNGIWILDRDTGDTTLVSDPETYVEYLTWAPDGDQLFATSWSYGQAHTVVWRYRVSDQEFTAVVLPFGGALSPVVVDSSVVDAYFAGEPVEPSLCRTPQGQPSGRSGICTFEY
jgi:hypothetical protein